MVYYSAQYHRQSLRLKNYDYSSQGAYFLTICTHRREIMFDMPSVSQMVVQTWNHLSDRFLDVGLDEFVVMPNHVHGIIWIERHGEINRNVGAIHELPLQATILSRRSMLLPKVIGYFKMNTAKRINEYLKKSGNPVWQRNYYERIIRTQRELENIRQYIRDNPKNWEKDPDNI